MIHLKYISTYTNTNTCQNPSIRYQHPICAVLLSFVRLLDTLRNNERFQHVTLFVIVLNAFWTDWWVLIDLYLNISSGIGNVVLF